MKKVPGAKVPSGAKKTKPGSKPVKKAPPFAKKGPKK